MQTLRVCIFFFFFWMNTRVQINDGDRLNMMDCLTKSDGKINIRLSWLGARARVCGYVREVRPTITPQQTVQTHQKRLPTSGFLQQTKCNDIIFCSSLSLPWHAIFPILYVCVSVFSFYSSLLLLLLILPRRRTTITATTITIISTISLHHSNCFDLFSCSLLSLCVFIFLLQFFYIFSLHSFWVRKTERTNDWMEASEPASECVEYVCGSTIWASGFYIWVGCVSLCIRNWSSVCV